MSLWRVTFWPCTLDQLLAHVLRLPRAERARVAEELLASIEEADETAIEAAWVPELERRAREVAKGKVETVAWGAVQEELLAALEERRARRAAS